jgi:hypothetical protein
VPDETVTAGPAYPVSMKLFARLHRPGFGTLLIVAAVLSVVLAACNNGTGGPAY